MHGNQLEACSGPPQLARTHAVTLYSSYDSSTLLIVLSCLLEGTPTVPYRVGPAPLGRMSGLTSEGVGQCVVWCWVTNEPIGD